MWRCQYCETFNKDEAVICEVCGNPKGSQSKMPEAAPAEPKQAYVILDQQPDTGYGHNAPEAPKPAPEASQPAAEQPVYTQPVTEEAPAPRKKRGWVIWLVLVLVIALGAGAASWFIFEEEIRTFIADFRGGDENDAQTENDGDQTVMPVLPGNSDGPESGSTAAPTENENVFSMGGGFMNNAGATDEPAAEITSEPVTEEPTAIPTVSADYVPPQSINSQSPAEDVIYLQNKLCELGLLNEGECTSGQYDTATATGVINFQRLINTERGYTVLSETGECDALTLSYVDLYLNADHTPVVNYVRYSSDVAMKDENITIVISSNIEADTLIMYREKGNVVKSWSAAGNSEISGTERIWTIEYAFEVAGDRSMSFAVSNDGGNSVSVSAEASISIVTPAPTSAPSVNSVEYNVAEAVIGEPVGITVKTNVDANYLVMYSEGGSTSGKWNAEGNSTTDGSVRVWTIEYKFNGGGKRSLEFASSNDGGATFGSRFAAPVINIVDVDVNSAEILQSVAYCDEAVSITVRSDAKARFLHMYNEGMKLVETWNADEASAVEGTDRVWSITHPFQKSGSRKVTFAVSYDGENTGAACEAHVLIAGDVPGISSVECEANEAFVGEPVSITVKTNADVAKLIMCSESGKPGSTWKAEGNSTVNSTERIWKVSYPFNKAGKRSLTFYAERADGTSSKGYEVKVEIVSVAPTVVSAAADKTTAVLGEEVTFTVVTNVNTEKLVMYSENGKAVKTWNADKNSSVNGDQRTWTVKYEFKGGGNRQMSFAVVNAYDGETSAAVPVNISVTSVEITAAAFINSIAYCDEYVTITAITDASARCLHMYKEDMKEAARWDADECSSVNGTKRTWNVTFKFATAGVRRMSFAASYDGETAGNPIDPKIITIVKDQPGVGYIHCDKKDAKVGEKVTITVKTNADAKTLVMKGESGSVVKSWPAENNSTLNGTERIWTIEYAFNTAGNRKIFFCASRDDGKTTGEDYEMTITIK